MKKIALPLWSGSPAARTTHLICLGALGLLAGCVSARESRVVSSPPPPSPTGTVMTTTTTSTPQPVQGTVTYVTTSREAPATNTIVVTQGPPAMQPEVVIARPSSQHQWIAGYWTWRNDRYEWMAGHWELPPQSDAVWVAPRWEQDGNAYRFYEGYWRR